MKRTSWILLLLLAIAIGVYFLIKYRGEQKALEVTETPETTLYLVRESETTLKSIRIFDKVYNMLEMQRNQEGFWDITLPATGTADQAKVSELESQINALTIVSEIGEVSSPADFGLTLPNYTIKLVYSNDLEHKIEVGNTTPPQSGYYVQLDDRKVFVVSQYSLDAILSLIANPPYPATVTPLPATEELIYTATPEIPSTTPQNVQPTP